MLVGWQGTHPGGTDPIAMSMGSVTDVLVLAPWHMGTSHPLHGPVPVPRVCAKDGGNGNLLSSPQTRVLVTHSISFLPQMDIIIVLADGQVSEVGSYPDLLGRNGSFANFLCNYASEEDKESMKEDSRPGIRHP